MSLETEMRDAETVQRFLDDPVIVGVFARIDQDMFARFKEQKTNEEIRTCWSVCQGIAHVRTELDKIVSNGQRAKATLADQEKKAERERNHVSRWTK